MKFFHLKLPTWLYRLLLKILSAATHYSIKDNVQLTNFNLTFAAIPPTNILFGITVPNFGAPLKGVPHGVVDGLTSAEDV
jgi:hypothetical protein